MNLDKSFKKMTQNQFSNASDMSAMSNKKVSVMNMNEV